MKQEKSKIASTLLLFPLIQFVLFLIFVGIATLLEKPCNNDGIYLFFVGIAFILLLFLPFTTAGTCITSFVVQIFGLRNHESKFRGIINIAICIAYVVAAIVFSVILWERAASV